MCYCFSNFHGKNKYFNDKDKRFDRKTSFSNRFFIKGSPLQAKSLKIGIEYPCEKTYLCTRKYIVFWL